LENIGVDGDIKRVLRKYDAKVWTGFIWLRTGSSGGLLNTVMKLQFA